MTLCYQFWCHFFYKTKGCVLPLNTEHTYMPWLFALSFCTVVFKLFCIAFYIPNTCTAAGWWTQQAALHCCLHTSSDHWTYYSALSVCSFCIVVFKLSFTFLIPVLLLADENSISFTALLLAEDNLISYAASFFQDLIYFDSNSTANITQSTTQCKHSESLVYYYVAFTIFYWKLTYVDIFTTTNHILHSS